MKDEQPVTPTDQTSTDSQETPTAPSLELTDSQASYLKGLNIEDPTDAESIVKIIDSAIKQKASVSRMSGELSRANAKLAGVPQQSEAQPEHQEDRTPSEPQPPKQGISDNDLFDLTQMVVGFPELVNSAQDGSIFNELRQMGYFGTDGYDKRSVHEYLSRKNDAAKELRELREFKEKHSTPNPAENPMLNAAPGLNLDGEMNRELARQIVLTGEPAARVQEAIAFLQSKL